MPTEAGPLASTHVKSKDAKFERKRRVNEYVAAHKVQNGDVLFLRWLDKYKRHEIEGACKLIYSNQKVVSIRIQRIVPHYILAAQVVDITLMRRKGE